MKKISWRARLLALMLCALLTLTACSGGTKSPASTDTPDTSTDTASQAPEETTGPVSGGVLTIGTGTVITNIGYTPEAGSNANIKFVRVAYNSLLNYDADGNIVGELATEWSTDAEAKTITYKLRENVTFSDGTAFNAEAVKWNLEEYATSGRTEVSGIDSIECPDANTVVITLTEWNSSRLESIGYFVLMMSPTAIQENGKEWAYTNTCGTGPFVSSEFIEGSSVTYVANTSYWEAGKPYLDGVTFSIITDATTIEYALENKEIDVLFDASAAIVIKYQGADGYNIYKNTSGYGMETLGVIPSSASETNADGSVNPWYYKEVRQALCYLLDSNELSQIISQGLKSPTNQWAIEGMSTYSPNVITYDVDVQKAKDLLAEAGFENGFSTKIYNVSGYYDDACTLIQTELAAAGITVEIVNLDATTFMGLMYNGWEGLYWHYASITPDLGLYMGRHLDVNATFYGMSLQHPDDAIALLNQIREAPTAEEKASLSWQLQELIYNDYALFGKIIYSSTPFIIAGETVQGGAWGQSHASGWDPADCWIEQ